MKVENLKNYGKSVSEIVDSTPISVMMKIGLIVIVSIIKETGIIGFIPFMFRVNKEKKRIIKENSDGYSKALKLGKEPANQFLTMTAMFNVVATKKVENMHINLQKQCGKNMLNIQCLLCIMLKN